MGSITELLQFYIVISSALVVTGEACRLQATNEGHLPAFESISTPRMPLIIRAWDSPAR